MRSWDGRCREYERSGAAINARRSRHKDVRRSRTGEQYQTDPSRSSWRLVGVDVSLHAVATHRSGALASSADTRSSRRLGGDRTIWHRIGPVEARQEPVALEATANRPRRSPGGARPRGAPGAPRRLRTGVRCRRARRDGAAKLRSLRRDLEPARAAELIAE